MPWFIINTLIWNRWENLQVFFQLVVVSSYKSQRFFFKILLIKRDNPNRRIFDHHYKLMTQLIQFNWPKQIIKTSNSAAPRIPKFSICLICFQMIYWRSMIKQIDFRLAWTVLLLTTIFVITVVKMLWTREVQPCESTTKNWFNSLLFELIINWRRTSTTLNFLNSFYPFVSIEEIVDGIPPICRRAFGGKPVCLIILRDS